MGLTQGTRGRLGRVVNLPIEVSHQVVPHPEDPRRFLVVKVKRTPPVPVGAEPPVSSVEVMGFLHGVAFNPPKMTRAVHVEGVKTFHTAVLLVGDSRFPARVGFSHLVPGNSTANSLEKKRLEELILIRLRANPKWGLDRLPAHRIPELRLEEFKPRA